MVGWIRGAIHREMFECQKYFVYFITMTTLIVCTFRFHERGGEGALVDERARRFDISVYSVPLILSRNSCYVHTPLSH